MKKRITAAFVAKLNRAQEEHVLCRPTDAEDLMTKMLGLEYMLKQITHLLQSIVVRKRRR